jgi:hypothetical protein
MAAAVYVGLFLVLEHSHYDFQVQVGPCMEVISSHCLKATCTFMDVIPAMLHDRTALNVASQTA